MNASQLPNLRLLYSRNQIQRRVKEMASELRHDYVGRDLAVVCVLKGAFMFAADLIREMGFEVGIHFVTVSSYGKGMVSSGDPHIEKLFVQSLAGMDVLIVEDILDTGLSMRALITTLQAEPIKSTKICVLIDKRERREVEVNADYVGFRLPAGFVAGYGIDWADQYRYLPEIYTAETSKVRPV